MLINKEVTILPYKKKNKLNELFQEVEIRMAFANKTPEGYQQVHDGVRCRDYLGDVLFSEQIKEKVSIYGFSYNPVEAKIDRDKTRMVLHFPNATTRNNFLENQELINKIEKDLKLSLTRTYRVTGEANTLIVEGDKFWLRATITMSFYTFLLKCMSYKFVNLDNWFEELQKQNNTTEVGFAKRIKAAYPYYTKYMKKLVYNLPYVSGHKEKQPVSSVHNNSGFVYCVGTWATTIPAMRLQKLMKAAA